MDNWHFRFRRRGFSLWSIKSGQSGALVVKVSEEDENIRDSAFEGWMANRAEGTTSRKDLMEAGPEEVTEAVAGGSRPVKVGSRYFCPPL